MFGDKQRILVIDASSFTLFVAYWQPGQGLSWVAQSASMHRSESISHWVGALRRAAEEPAHFRSPEHRLDGIIVGAGPGSFTGIRAALAYAKGLGLAVGCPVYAISSLSLWAICSAWSSGSAEQPEYAQSTWGIMRDARRGDAFVGGYTIGYLKAESLDGWSTMYSDRCIDVASGADLLAGSKLDGLLVDESIVTQAVGNTSLQTLLDTIKPRILGQMPAIGDIVTVQGAGEQWFGRGFSTFATPVDDLHAWVPNYLRGSAPEMDRARAGVRPQR